MRIWLRIICTLVAVQGAGLSAFASGVPSFFPFHSIRCPDVWGESPDQRIEQQLAHLNVPGVPPSPDLTSESAHALKTHLYQWARQAHSSSETSHRAQMWQRFAVGFHLLEKFDPNLAAELGFSLFRDPLFAFDHERFLELLDHAVLHSKKIHPKWLVDLLASYTSSDMIWRGSDYLELAELARLLQQGMQLTPPIEVPLELLRVRVELPLLEFTNAQWQDITAWELHQMTEAAQVFADYARQHGDVELARRFQNAANELGEFLALFPK